MLHRCDSRPRLYTELCNRSSSGGGSPQVGRAGMRTSHSFETFEDYWEDASVSLMSNPSWEAPSNPLLRAPPSAHVTINEEEENKKFSGLGSSLDIPHRNSFDVNESLACARGRRSFPPPLASCSILSIKEGGRFVLKERDADRPHGFFRAQRGNGRLRLQLVMPDEVNENGNICSLGVSESRSEFFDEFGHVEHYSLDEEALTRSDQVERLSCDEEDVKGNVEDMEVSVCRIFQDVGTEAGCPTLDQVQGAFLEDPLDFDGGYGEEPYWDISNGGKEVDLSERGNFSTFGKRELNQFVAESSSSKATVDVFGPPQQEPIWNMEVANQAMTSLSPWPPNQMCLHQSLVRMGPALGLAMS